MPKGVYIRGLSVEERFWSKVDLRPDDCWIWRSAGLPSGYGQFTLRRGHAVYAHRWAYEQENGPIPKGMHIDHLCRTPECVRPDHMEVVTRYENHMRGVSPPAANARKERCLRGHLFDQPPGRGQIRRCAECNRMRRAERYTPHPRELKPCGTWGGYRRHLRAGERACAICRKAVTARMKELRKAKVTS